MDEELGIYILEDNKAILERIEGHVAEYTAQNRLKAKICAVNEHFEGILEEITVKSNQNNVYFLDIILGGPSNGLRLAQKIRGRDIQGYIIFITSHMEFAFPAIQYKIRALDYILKNSDDLRSRIYQCLDTICAELSGKHTDEKEQTILIRTNGTHFIIPVNDIIYFETNTVRRSIIVHTPDKKIEFRDTLEELQKRLNDKFYRCHRSYLINLNHVQQISRKRNDMHVLLSNGAKCLISPRYLRGLLKLGKNYA